MKYVGEYVHTYQRALTASAVSGLNLMVRSKPGWGKSRMAYEAGQAIAGKPHTVLMRLHEATSPDEVQGRVDIQGLVNGSDGIKRILDGTPYDPDARIVILDEFSRCEMLVYNLLLHATERLDVPTHLRPVFWATTNWMIASEKTEALRDRFGLWYYMDADVDFGEIAIANLSKDDNDPTWTAGFPDWEKCLACRAEVASSGTASMIADFVSTVAAEAINAKLDVNPRRVAQWANLLWRMTYYETGKQNAELSSGALASMVFAYPCVDEQSAKNWQKVCMSVVNRVEQAIEAYLMQVREKFLEIANSPVKDRSSRIIELGQMLAEIERNLTKIAGDNNPAARKAMESFNAIFAKAAKGEMGQ